MSHPPDPVRALVADLDKVLRERARGDLVSRAIYATDASLYETMPLAVAFPRSAEEVEAALGVAREHRCPVLARGAGTSLAGQTVAAALVLDLSRHMTRVLSVNPEARRARVEPGAVLDHLNRAARPHGLQFGPDVATSSRATLGGMIGNNSCGSHSIVHGKTVDHVRGVDVVLAEGERLRLAAIPRGELDAAARGGDRRSRLVAELSALVAARRGEIEARYPKIMRHVTGYNLDALLAGEEFNPASVVVGSEGTLGIVTEAELSLVERAKATVVGVVVGRDVAAVLDLVPEVLALSPSAVELIDGELLRRARANPSYAPLARFVPGEPGALLAVEFAGASAKQARAGLARLRDALGSAEILALEEPDAQARLWSLRKAGLGLLMGMKGDAKPVAFVEDTAVAPERLGEYMRRFDKLLAARGVPAAVYGHASVGCLHIRPILDVKRDAGVSQLRELSREVAALVHEFGGAMSGEHGDGRARSLYLEQFYGPDLVAAFAEVKRAFDPLGLLNPGNIVAPRALDAELRYDRDYLHVEGSSLLDWSGDGGFQRAVELCNGNGMCRKQDAGTMCPSYMATRDEEHSTRGRANALRAWLGGRVPAGHETEKRVAEVLDLCLECKGCRSECPSGVDMAKMKLEFMGRLRARGESRRRDRFFAQTARRLEQGSRWARLVNPLLGVDAVRRGAAWALGLDPRRPLPRPATRDFRAWFRSRKPAAEAPRGRIVLLDDTYTRYLVPHVGQAAVAVLEALGFAVELAPIACCGRPLLAKGFVAEARELVRANLDKLAPLANQGLTIVGLEPSCLLTFRDEALSLCPGLEADRVAASSVLLSELVATDHGAADFYADKPFTAHALVHGHCHQKALAPEASPCDALSLVPGIFAEEVDSGCCGLAGAFGYEKEHYDLSMAVGERVLFKAVRREEPDTVIVSDGYSCRSQIEHGTGRKALHTAELLARALAKG